MNVDYKAIGRRIAKRRNELGLRQREVCEKIGVNYKYLSNIETARCAPSIDVIMNICEALNTSPNYLLLGTVSPEKAYHDELSLKGRKLVNEIEALINRYEKE